MQQRTGSLKLLARVASVLTSALPHVAAELLSISLNNSGLAAACRECLGQTQGADQLHQVSVTSGTRHPWHKVRDNKNRAKTQWKVEQKVK
eukprot:641396-Pelagomonas_calceolata.AAC.1